MIKVEKLQFLMKRMEDKKEFIVSGKFHNYTYYFTSHGQLIDRLFGGYAISHITLNELLDYDLELKETITTKKADIKDHYVIEKDGITFYKNGEPRMKVKNDGHYFMIDNEWIEVRFAFDIIRKMKEEKQ